MRIASYNVENLFARAKALQLPTWAQGRNVLEQHARINVLFNEPVYTAAVKTEIVQLLKALGLYKKDDGGKFALLRQNRGRLLKRTGGRTEIVAAGRTDWVGWVELKTEPVNELSTRHTAMVMRDVNADVQCVVEADNRVALKDFSGIMLGAIGAQPFDHVMLIDGNDNRGIDVGILTRRSFDLAAIRSHVDDQDQKGIIFSRDCPEYSVTTPSGAELIVLVNHLKSKGFGSAADSNSRRLRQASRVAEIYRGLRNAGHANVAVAGDFNDTPNSQPLAPLLGNTDLKDVSSHPSFTDDGRPGTFANGTKANKIDYILLSPALFQKTTGGGVFRKGVWGGTNGTLWARYPTMQKKVQQASDHAAIYCDLNL